MPQHQKSPPPPAAATAADAATVQSDLPPPPPFDPSRSIFCFLLFFHGFGGFFSFSLLGFLFCFLSIHSLQYIPECEIGLLASTFV